MSEAMDDIERAFDQELFSEGYSTPLETLYSNFENDIWIQKNGDGIKVADMSTKHVFNSARMLERGKKDSNEDIALKGLRLLWIDKLNEVHLFRPD